MLLENLLSERTRLIQSNAIREILKVVSQPGMVSLAGGIPAPESFPLPAIADLERAVMDRYGSLAFQYDLTEGFVPLRDALVGYVARASVSTTSEQVVVTSGSQGALDTLGKILITPGDRVAVEAPTYLGALSAFNPYGPEYVQLATDEEGMVPESLEEQLRHGPIKLVYLVPTFQNPGGRTLTLRRRKEIGRIVAENDLLLVEDDPYRELRYRGDALPAIHSFAPDNVVYLGTFSKVFAPGFRVGFAVAPEVVRRWMVLAKQGTDLHTSTYSQALCAEYLSSGELERHLPEIVEIYRPRRDAMISALEACFPPWMQWSDPDGGMFIWARTDSDLDTLKLYDDAVARKVAFVPGRFFFANPDDGRATMRLNFTMNNPEQITDAVHTLGELLAERE